jgi:hypothetical protein
MSPEEAEHHYSHSNEANQKTPPMSIPLSQHRDDLFALPEMFENDQPPEIQARKQSVHLLL